MSTTRTARYTGPSGTGVDLTIRLQDGQERLVHVPHGEALPAELGGVSLDENFLNTLLQQDGWDDQSSKQATKPADKPAAAEKE